MQLKFKMLTLRQIVPQIRSEDWFVTIDLKDAYFHISILPCHWRIPRFAFGGKAYQYRVLLFGQALSPHTFTKCIDAVRVPLWLQGIRIMNYINDWLILAQSHQLAVRHRDAVLANMKELGLRLNAKKSVLSRLQRTTFLGVVWDSTSMQARLSPTRIESILSAVNRIRLGQSLTVKQFQRLLGLMAAASNDTFWMIALDCCTWYLLDCCTWDLYSGGSDRCLSHGLGSDPRGTLESRSVEGPASLMTHQPSGDVGCISCSQEFPCRSQGPPCACPLR